MKFLRITIITVIALIMAGFVIFATRNDPQHQLITSMEFLAAHHIYLILAIFVLTLISTLTGLPVLYLGVALGFFIPYLTALILAWTIQLFAVMTTFFMVRRVYYAYFRKRYGEKKLIRRINMRIRKYRFWTVAVTRGVYFIPTNIINFSFPLSRITTRQYLVGTMTGLIPECLINVTTGYLLKHQLMLLDSPQQNLQKIVLIGTYLLLMATLFLFLRNRKNRADKSRLKKIIPLLKEQEN